MSFFYKIIFNWEFSRSKLLASHANKSTVQSANGDGFLEGAFVGKKVNRILAKAMVVALLQMGYNLQATTVHD